MISRHSFRSTPALLALAALLAWTDATPAQPVLVGKPNPQAPTLNPVLPLGAQRGTTLDLTLTGTNLADPTGLWTSFPAKVTIPADGKNGKDNTKLLVKLEVPKDAPLGFHTLRLATRRGMSNVRLFCIDELPQVVSKTTHRTPSTAEGVPVPCVVVGTAGAEATDYYKIAAKPGQRISFEVLGRRLGSAFDPQLTLLDARTGREMPNGFSNDAPGLQTDPRLTYTFKEAGDYLVAIRDVSYRGGADYHYRLRIGDFPCATTPLPMAAKRGSKVSIRFAGPNVEGIAPVEITAPTDPTVQAIQVAPKGTTGLYGWPVMLALSDLDEVVEQEPNNEAAKANRIPVPGAITARFEQKGDKDYFVFKAKKGTKYVIEAHSHEYLSPTEVYMTLHDAKGAQIQASNPAAAPRFEFAAPADADYTIAVEHLHYWGGPAETYRVTVTPSEPSFRLLLPLDRYDVAQGGTASFPLVVTRQGYNGPIEVSVVGAKGLSGKVTIPAGPPKPPNQPSGTLVLTAAPDLPVGPLVFHVEGKATINGKVVTQFASVQNALRLSLAQLPVPPRTAFIQVALAVKPAPPFTLTAKFDAPSANPGKPAPLTVTVTRKAGFTGDVVLSAVGMPPGVTAALKNIPAKQMQAKGQFNLTPKVKPGKYTITIQGKAKHEGTDYTVSAPPVPLEIKK